MGNMVYGCDICQDVCPWNRGTERRSSELESISGLVDLAHWLSEDGRALIDQYSRFFVPRRDAKFLRRNALIALGNSGDPQAAALVAPFLESGDPMLVEHALWALKKLGGPIAAEAIAGYSNR
jgi:epoxyqueuosine reductase